MSATVAEAAPAPTAQSFRLSSWQAWGVILIAPYLLVFLFFVIYPIGYGLWLARSPESYTHLAADGSGTVQAQPADLDINHLTLTVRRSGLQRPGERGHHQHHQRHHLQPGAFQRQQQHPHHQPELQRRDDSRRR